MSIELVEPRTYNEFLDSKTDIVQDFGFDIELSEINDICFNWQKAVIRWSVKKGRAALFEDCGLGKTFQQIEWLKIIMNKTKNIDGIGLIVCPLSVAEQTISEAKRLGYNLKYVKNYSECESSGMPIFITNYQRLDGFKNANIKAVVLDESSILKSIGGKIKDKLIKMFENVQYKLSCTATPSPNDLMELGNQVEFLGIMKRREMLSKFFVNDAKAGTYRLKGHGKEKFYRWLSSWSVFIRTPSDIGFSDEGYVLPKLNIIPIYLDATFIPEGELFPTTDIKGIQGRAQVRRETAADKVDTIARIINASEDQWLIFCGINAESELASKKINDSVEVAGKHSLEKKNKSFIDFKNGTTKAIVTKPKIGGFGMNFQQSHYMAFIGLGDSYELYYQCIRRQYRFGQKDPVNVYIVLTNSEQVIYKNILKKEKQNNRLYDEVVKNMQDFTKKAISHETIEAKDNHSTDKVETGHYTAYLGDVTETIKQVKDNSVDLQIFSPEFLTLFTYSPSPRDMGNCDNDNQFWEHFDFIIPDIFRVLKPGRVCAVHCMDVPATLVHDGFIGLKDFPGDIIRHFQNAGFVYDGRAIIPKNPQAQSIRTHAKGLTFTQFEKDSAWSRPSLPDYLIKFRKPGNNIVPIENGNGKEISRDDWIDLAGGVWKTLEDFIDNDIIKNEINHLMKKANSKEEKMISGLLNDVWENIRETRTLNTIKYPGDEKHMCPLQLDTIHNAVRLWSNPGEIVHTPFGGIGSEGYQAILDGRKAILHELKPEYFDQMIENLNRSIEKLHEGELKFK